MSLSPFACLSTHEVCKPRNYSLNEQKHLQVRDWLALYFDIPALNRCNIINWHASLPKFVNLKLEQIIILHLLQQKNSLFEICLWPEHFNSFRMKKLLIVWAYFFTSGWSQWNSPWGELSSLVIWCWDGLILGGWVTRSMSWIL